MSVGERVIGQPPGADVGERLTLLARNHTPPDVRATVPIAFVSVVVNKDRTREWISVSGLATVSRDRQKIRELYATDRRAWFPDEGDPRHGTPDDPRLVLVGVDIHAAVFLEVNKPQPIVLFEMAKGWLSGRMPDYR